MKLTYFSNEKSHGAYDYNSLSLDRKYILVPTEYSSYICYTIKV